MFEVKVRVTQLCPALCNPVDYIYSPWNSLGQNTGVDSLEYWSGQPYILQWIFPTQGSNPGLPHCRQILYQLSHKGSPTILEWVAYPLKRIFLTQEWNQGLLHCRWILYQLSYNMVKICLRIHNQKRQEPKLDFPDIKYCDLLYHVVFQEGVVDCSLDFYLFIK